MVEERHSRRVLIVEDDASIRRLVKAVLQRDGYVIETAADGLEAVTKLGESDYDAIILDLMMPHLDGFTFINDLSDTNPQRLDRIIVTSAASPAVINERLQVRPFAILPKPFDIDRLREVVRECVSFRRD